MRNRVFVLDFCLRSALLPWMLARYRQWHTKALEMSSQSSRLICFIFIDIVIDEGLLGLHHSEEGWNDKVLFFEVNTDC